MTHLNGYNTKTTEILTPRLQYEKTPVKLTRLGKTVVALTLGLALLGGVKTADALTTDYKISDDDVAVTVLRGEGVQSLINRTTENIDDIDIREVALHVENDPSNAKVFEDGQLNPGESVNVPKEIIEQ